MTSRFDRAGSDERGHESIDRSPVAVPVIFVETDDVESGGCLSAELLLERVAILKGFAAGDLLIQLLFGQRAPVRIRKRKTRYEATVFFFFESVEYKNLRLCE